jgi:Spy/CpxP family protein refolding chaperone
MQAMYDSKNNEVSNLIEKEIENQKRINELKDLVSNLQKENGELRVKKGGIFK